MDEVRLEPLQWTPRALQSDAVIQDTRRWFGWPDDQPVVVTGHQPVAPHPGILTKYIAAEAWAKVHDAHVAHVVIDTGMDLVARVDVPVGAPPSGLHVVTHTLAEELSGPLMGRAAARPQTVSVASLDAALASGIMHLQEAWQHAPQDDAASQAWAVVQHVMQPWVSPAPVVYASQLLQSPLGMQWLEAMQADAQACVQAYNRAVAQYPEAQLSSLAEGDNPELPLWVIDGPTRRSAYASDLALGHQVVPRALLTTALVRSVGDLFVHGMGGMRYDQVMEAWVGAWRPVTLAPKVLATASCRLPLGEASSYAQARQEVVTAHRRARHDPDGGGAGMSVTKQRLLDEIARHDRGTPGRQAAFDALQAYIHQGAHDVEPVSEAVAAIDRSAEIAARRDWPAVLHPSMVIDQLAAKVQEGVSGAASRRPSKSARPSHHRLCQ